MSLSLWLGHTSWVHRWKRLSESKRAERLEGPTVHAISRSAIIYISGGELNTTNLLLQDFTVSRLDESNLDFHPGGWTADQPMSNKAGTYWRQQECLEAMRSIWYYIGRGARIGRSEAGLCRRSVSA